MNIAVASGKGGTGKTTIATNLAAAVSRTGLGVQYLDCDVEEPNGHIFLKPEIGHRDEVAVGVPEVDTEKCIGCGRCNTQVPRTPLPTVLPVPLFKRPKL